MTPVSTDVQCFHAKPAAPPSIWNAPPKVLTRFCLGIALALLGGFAGTVLTVKTGNPILSMGFGTLLLGAGVTYAWSAYSQAVASNVVAAEQHSWELHPEFLVRRTAENPLAFPYAAVAEYQYFKVNPLDAALSLRFKLRDGSEYIIDSSVEDHETLAREFVARIAGHLLAETRATLEQGLPVTFGPLQLTDEYIEHRGRKYEWANIKRLEFRTGSAPGNALQLVGTLHDDGMLSSIVQNMEQVPNACVFEELIKATHVFAPAG